MWSSRRLLVGAICSVIVCYVAKSCCFDIFIFPWWISCIFVLLCMICWWYVQLVVTNKILGTPCIVVKIERWKFGETFKARVPDDPNAIVEPKILGTETFWDKGDSRISSKKFKREARLWKNLSRDWFWLNYWASPEIPERLLKIYELLGGRKNVPDERWLRNNAFIFK